MVTQTLQKAENVTWLSGIKWQTYQSLLLDLAESPNKKLTYDQGYLEIMSPLPEHEINKGFLAHLVRATTELLDLEVASLCSTTLSRKDLKKGIEPDECFYIQNESLVRGKTTFDFTKDPAPDLAIEIDITSSSLNRLDIYAALSVLEIWRFDGEQLFIYVLQNGHYQDTNTSQCLPILSKEVLLSFLQRRHQTGENALIREFRQWLQTRTK